MSGIAGRTRIRRALVAQSLLSSTSGVASSRSGVDHPSGSVIRKKRRERCIDEAAGQTSEDRRTNCTTRRVESPSLVGGSERDHEVILLASSGEENYDPEKFSYGKKASGAKQRREVLFCDLKMCAEGSRQGRPKTERKRKSARRKRVSSRASEHKESEERSSKGEDGIKYCDATNETSPSGKRCDMNLSRMELTNSTSAWGSNGNEENVILVVDSSDEGFDEIFLKGSQSMKGKQEVVSDAKICAGVECPGKKIREVPSTKRNLVLRKRYSSSSEGEDVCETCSGKDQEETDDYQGGETDDHEDDVNDDSDSMSEDDGGHDYDVEMQQEELVDKDDVGVKEMVDLVSSNGDSSSEDGDDSEKSNDKNCARRDGVLGTIKLDGVKPRKAREGRVWDQSLPVSRPHHPIWEDNPEAPETNFDHIEGKDCYINDDDMKGTGKTINLHNNAAYIAPFSCVAKRTRLSFRKFFANKYRTSCGSGCIDLDEASLSNEDDSGENFGGVVRNDDHCGCNCNDKSFEHNGCDAHLCNYEGVAVRRCGTRVKNDKIFPRQKFDGVIHIDNGRASGDTDLLFHIRKKKNGASTMRKVSNAVIDDSLFDVLMESINSRRDLFFENDEHKPVEEKQQGNHIDLLSFSFKEPEHHRNSDSDNELNDLWDDLDFVLGSEKIESSVQETKVESPVTLLGSTSHSNLKTCQHEFLLDEQIGIVCRICKIVKEEIKYCMPPMFHYQINPVYEPERRKASLEEDGSVLRDFDCQKLEDHDFNSNVFYGRTVWDLIPDLKGKMFKHQKEGFEFIWKNLAGTIFLEELRTTYSDDIGGCLISHAPGTGKTLLTIAFMKSFLHVFDDCRPMIVAPVTLLPTWEREFRRWGFEVPFHILNYKSWSGQENKSAMELFFSETSNIGCNRRKNLQRIIKIFSWIGSKSVLGISYGMFRKLTMEKEHSDKEGLAIRQLLLEYPGLLVLDEGHTARNRQSRVWQCLKRVKTQRRIMLSGTPFQNDFVQLFNTLYVIRPKFAEGISEGFKKSSLGVVQLPEEDRFQDKKEKILRRTFATISEGIEPEENSAQLKELRSIIDPFIHVHERTDHDLPGLRDYFIYLCPSDLQKCILDKLIRGSTFDYDHKVSCISVHPSVLLKINDEKDQAIIQEHFSDLQDGRVSDGVKLRFVTELVQLCESLHEKVAVFSQFIHPLSIIEAHLTSFFGWTVGRELLHLDGRVVDQKRRQSLIHSFNKSKEVKVILVSTKVCAEGIDLTGSSRVVLLDLVWNPSVRRQAIGRSYRIGQKKVVYAYNLIASDTMEERKYSVQDIKDKFSQLFFSPSTKNLALIDCMEDCTDKVLGELIAQDKAGSFFEKVVELKSCRDN